MNSLEISILDAIQNLRTAFFDGFFPWITALTNRGEIWLILGAALLIFRKTRKWGIGVLLALALNFICCNALLKPFIARERPFTVNPHAAPLVERPGSYSFPSGHTSASFAAAMALVFAKTPKKLWIPAVTVAALIGLSRLYVYVHYPTDVLAGALLGTLVGFLAQRIVRAGEKRRGSLWESKSK